MFARLSWVSRGLCRGYVRLDQVPVWLLDRYHWSVPNLIDCKAHRDFLVNNEAKLPPSIISYSLNRLVDFGMQLDENWPEICVLVKRNLKTYDRHVAADLYQVSHAMGLLGEKNPELWEIVETKLVTEGLVRYLTESQCANLIYALAVVGKGSNALFAKLEAEVQLHYLAMETQDIETAIEGLAISGKGTAKTMENLTKYLKGEQSVQIPA